MRPQYNREIISPKVAVPVETEPAQQDSSPFVLVVDDDIFFREHVASFLRRRHFEVLEAADSQSAYALAIRHHPMVAIVDIVLPKHPLAPAQTNRNQGIELASRLKQADRSMAVVIYSGFPDRSRAVLELAAEGVRGLAYIVKGFRSGPAVLLQAIEEARAGHIMIRSDEPDGATSLVDQFWARLTAKEQELIGRAVELFPTLSAREREVAFALAHAQTVQGTADLLGMAEATAEKHINHIYSKLELDRADLEESPLRKSILLAKVCWLVELQGDQEGG